MRLERAGALRENLLGAASSREPIARQRLARAQARTFHWEGRAPEPLDADARAALAPATHSMLEWQSYWLYAPGADALRVGRARIEPELRDCFRVRFRNQLGLATLEPLCAGRPLGPPLCVEVLSPKFSTLEAHRSFLSTLIAALDRDVPAALFDRSGQSPTAFRTTRDPLRGPDAERLARVLTDAAPALYGALASLRARHELRAQQTERFVSAGEVRDVSALALLDAVADPLAHPGYRQRRAQRWVPARVREVEHVDAHDTDANRTATLIVRVAAAACRALGASAGIDGRALVPLGSTLDRALSSAPLSAFAQEPMPDELLPMTPRAMRFDAYRTLETLRVELTAADRATLVPSLERARAARDIAVLYEQWVFFALLRSIERAHRVRCDLVVPARGLLSGVVARFEGVGSLHYNRSVRAYSGEQRPDFLWYEQGRPAVAFDAKFRLDTTQLTKSRARRDDLDRMHAYRDALSVRAAVCVYPGDESVFYDARGREGGPLELPRLLGGAQGVGALAMHPAKSALERR